MRAHAFYLYGLSRRDFPWSSASLLYSTVPGCLPVPFIFRIFASKNDSSNV